MDNGKSVLDIEHAKYFRMLEEVCSSQLNCKNLILELSKITKKHNEMETELVFPIVKHLSKRFIGNSKGELVELIKNYELFVRNYSRLIEDHGIMRKLLEEVKARSYRVGVCDAIDQMLQHLQMEEEVVYPLVGAFGEILSYMGLIERNTWLPDIQ